MSWRNATAPVVGAACVGVLAICAPGAGVRAQQPPPAGGGSGRGGGGVGGGLFTAADANKDGLLTRDELKSTVDKWFTDWDSGKTGALTQDQLVTGFSAVFPQAAGGGGRGGAQNQTPKPEDLPGDDGRAPRERARQTAAAAQGPGARQGGRIVHSSIPLAAKTVEALGTKTGAWTTTITYDPADINTAESETVRRYLPGRARPARFSTIPTMRRRPRRAGRHSSTSCAAEGLAGIHAATDSYHARARRRPGVVDAAASDRATSWRGAGRAGRQEQRPEVEPGRVRRRGRRVVRQARSRQDRQDCASRLHPRGSRPQ